MADGQPDHPTPAGGGPSPAPASPSVQPAPPAPDVQTEIKKAVDAQAAAFASQRKELTGHESLDALRQARLNE